MTKAVFLDRDGVINHLVKRDNGRLTSPWKLEEFNFIDGVQTAVKLIRSYDYKIFVITNQPGIVEGDMTEEDLEKINDNIRTTLNVDEIICAKMKNSNFYKPNNGMIEYLINKHNIIRVSSYMIGDRWKDIVPGYNSGLSTIYIGNKYTTEQDYTSIYPNYIASSLLDASFIIMRNEG